jgi:DNA-binding CsgD family transcriptional regulator
MADSRWLPKRGAALSDREQAVLRLIADGLSDRAIACALAVAEKTVQMHCRNLAAKTGCTNRSQLTRYAVAQGLVPLEWSPQASGDEPPARAAVSANGVATSSSDHAPRTDPARRPRVTEAHSGQALSQTRTTSARTTGKNPRNVQAGPTDVECEALKGS